MSRLLDDDEIIRQLAGLPGWRRVDNTIRAAYEHADFAAAMRSVVDVADIAEEMDHHPDIDIRYTRTVFSLWTHVHAGVTQLDIELAHRIREVAERSGAAVDAS